MLKIMTLNINYYADKHGNWENRKLLIRDAIRDNEPHVVALQAVRRDPAVHLGVDQAMQIAGLLAGIEDVVYQPAQQFEDGSEHGSAFVARIPVVESMAVPLSLQEEIDDTNERVLLYTRYALPDGPLHVLNAHFSWNDDQAIDNVAEAVPVLERINGPAVLVGDLNQTADKPSMKALAEAGWVDAWGALKPEQPGYTFEADDPSIRIDYMWVNNTLLDTLRRIDIISPYPDDSGIRFGDHLGLLAAFDLEP